MSFSVFIFITVLSSIEVQFRARRFVEGASGMDEKLLLEKVFAFTNADVRPVNNSSEAVNVTLDITFHGVIDMVTTDIKQYCL